MTAPMDAATAFAAAETDEAQEAVLAKHSPGYIRKGLRQWALRLERAAERATSEDAAELEQAALQAWALREALTIDKAEAVVFVPTPEFVAAVNDDLPVACDGHAPPVVGPRWQ